MSWDEDGNACQCGCSGCSLHVEQEDRWSWNRPDYSATDRLWRLACEVLGHKPRTMLRRWVQCDRCGEHLSGPKPDPYQSFAAYVDNLYMRPGCNARLTGIKDHAISH